MPLFLIERHLPGVDTMDSDQLAAVVRRSNAVVADLQNQVKWNLSYVVEGKTFCLVEAPDEEMVREHARLSGFPCNAISRVHGTLNPAAGVLTPAPA